LGGGGRLLIQLDIFKKKKIAINLPKQNTTPLRRRVLGNSRKAWKVFYRIVCMKSIAIMKYSVKNNMNYTQDGCGGGYGRA
jgi:hypothetical protein